MKIGFTYDCREDYIKSGFDLDKCNEFDSRETIDNIASTLSSLGHEVIKIGNVKELINCLVNGDRWDIVFNIAEGIKGGARESQVPTVLEIYDIPYVFSDSVAMSIALNKGLTKRLVRDAGIRTADFCILENLNLLSNIIQYLQFPLFVKPNADGSSNGVNGSSVVDSEKKLYALCDSLFKLHGQPILIEKFLPGREFTVGIIGTGADAKVLGVIELKLRYPTIDLCYSHHIKYNEQDNVDCLIATDPEAMLAAENALKVWRLLGCRDAGRVDFRSDNINVPYFLEVNPLAGLASFSDLPILCEKVLGMYFPELIENILNSAVSRYPVLARKQR